MVYGCDRSPLSCSMITRCKGGRIFFHFFPFSSLWVSRRGCCCPPSVAAEVKPGLWYGAETKSIRLLSSCLLLSLWRNTENRKRGDLQFLRDTGDLRDSRVRSFSNAIRAGTISCPCTLASSGDEKRENLRNKATESKRCWKKGECVHHEHVWRRSLRWPSWLPFFPPALPVSALSHPALSSHGPGLQPPRTRHSSCPPCFPGLECVGPGYGRLSLQPFHQLPQETPMECVSDFQHSTHQYFRGLYNV